MGLLFNKKENDKDNGINWQKEVFDISKALPSMVQKLGNIDKNFDDHVEAGREQRKEDKIWQTKLLENSLDCARGKQINGIQDDIDTLNTDKKISEGKFLGVKSVYAFIIGAIVLIGGVLGILWRLGLL